MGGAAFCPLHAPAPSSAALSSCPHPQPWPASSANTRIDSDADMAIKQQHSGPLDVLRVKAESRACNTMHSCSQIHPQAVQCWHHASILLGLPPVHTIHQERCVNAIRPPLQLGKAGTMAPPSLACSLCILHQQNGHPESSTQPCVRLAAGTS